MGGESPNLDAFLAWLASRQHGVVTQQQLLAAGFGRRVIGRRLAKGGLIPVHRGIYLVGHRAVSPQAYGAAAILACAPDALLSHMTAARRWGLPVPDGNLIHVTTVGRSRRSLRSIRLHYVKQLAPSERRQRDGLPLTSPALMTLDLAGSLGITELTRALNEARVLRLGSDMELESTLERHSRRKGARALRRLLAAERGPSLTRFEAERRALHVMRAHGIEPDATDHPAGHYRVDFWFERERLAARDVQVFPLTWADLSRPETSMARLRRTLVARRTR